MAHSGFVPLRVFSSYTMLEGAIEPKAIAKRAKELGFPAVAVTDRNGLYAVMSFSDECKKAGVQPIVGTMLGVARPHRPEGAPLVIDWLALYAQDDAGYDNLCALVSMAHLDRPIELDAHVPFSALEGRTDGLIALTAGVRFRITAQSPEELFADALHALTRPGVRHLMHQLMHNRAIMRTTINLDETLTKE